MERRFAGCALTLFAAGALAGCDRPTPVANEAPSFARLSATAGRFFQFTPLANSAACTVSGGDPVNPILLPPGFSQIKIADESQFLLDVPDMNALSLDGRYLYRTHEFASNGGVSVTDLGTGLSSVVVQRVDWEGLDGIQTTPWGTILFAEERTVATLKDPLYPNAVGGLVYELDPVSKVVTARIAIGARSHEGMIFDKQGNLYGISESSTGPIFKFVPDVTGDLSSGQLYALKITSDAGNRTGVATWIPLDRNAVQVDSDAEALLKGATSYNRPQDIDIFNGRLVVAVTAEHRVLSIELGASTYFRVGDLVARGKNVDTEFESPDNLAVLDGLLFIAEDPGGNLAGGKVRGDDIWVAREDNEVVTVKRFASINDCDAEPTGLLWDEGRNQLYVNIQHRGGDRIDLAIAIRSTPAGGPTTGTVAGTVTTPVSGVDLSGALVTIQTGGFTGTVAAGGYSVSGVTPGTKTITVSNLPTGCVAPAAVTVVLNAGTTATAPAIVVTGCTPPAGGSVAGTVNSSLGGGLVGVTVTLTPTSGPGGNDATDAVGAYSIGSLAVGSAGSAAITAVPVGCTLPSPATIGPYGISTPGQVVTLPTVTVTCTAPTGTIKGTVTTPVTGVDLTGTVVTIQTGGFTGTVAAGAYSVSGVTPGTKSITVSNLPAGCAVPAAVTVVLNPGATATAPAIVVTGCTPPVGGSVVGTVISSRGGGLIGVTMTLTPTSGPGGNDATDAAGGYSIGPLAVGSAGSAAITGVPADCTLPSPATIGTYNITTPGQGATLPTVTVTCYVITRSSIVTTVAGTGVTGFTGDGGPAVLAEISNTSSIVFTPDGSYLISTPTDSRIRRVNPSGVISTIAGTGNKQFGGDGGPATAADLYFPHADAVAPDGSVYIADYGNCRVRRIDPAGIINTIVGTGGCGFSGDGGPANLAQVWANSLARASEGTLYLPEYSTYRVRRVDPNGIITTFAQLNHPGAVVIGPDGGVYVAEGNGNRIRRIAPNGTISTYAGTGISGYTGDGGPATSAQLNGPYTMAFGPDGALYFIDGGSVIRRIGTDGIISTVAGTGVPGYGGDGGPAGQAQFNTPAGLAFAPDGALLVGDSYNSRVRRIK